uniref:Uncharacterized protein n=1 Tax=Leersia perrieri TaxID=77586 RepID=A0A0D9XJB4_9ORYZ
MVGEKVPSTDSTPLLRPSPAASTRAALAGGGRARGLRRVSESEFLHLLLAPHPRSLAGLTIRIWLLLKRESEQEVGIRPPSPVVGIDLGALEKSTLSVDGEATFAVDIRAPAGFTSNSRFSRWKKSLPREELGTCEEF